MYRSVRVLCLLMVALLAAPLAGARQQRPVTPAIDVTVQEGTSMSVAVSPDGRTLAIDLQGGIWTVPAAGGAARRVTDVFEDARQPTWSPDGQWITYFSYRDGGYDLWSITPDGRSQHRLTWGPFDDREPAWSHDGTRVAFSSDRGNPLGSDYNIWVLDVRTGDLQQLTKEPSEDYMPSWSPDDREIAFASTRENGRSSGPFRSPTSRSVSSPRSTPAGVDAPSWGPGGTGGVSRHGERREPVRARRRSLSPEAKMCSRFAHRGRRPPSFFYVSDGKIRRRTLGAPALRTARVQRDASGDAAAVHAARARFHEHHAAQGARHRTAGDLA